MNKIEIKINVDELGTTPTFKPPFIVETGTEITFKLSSLEIPVIISLTEFVFGDGDTYAKYTNFKSAGDFSEYVSTEERFGSPLIDVVHTYINNEDSISVCNLAAYFTFADMTVKVYNLPIRVNGRVSSESTQGMKLLETKVSDIDGSTFAILETKSGEVIPATLANN